MLRGKLDLIQSVARLGDVFLVLDIANNQCLDDTSVATDQPSLFLNAAIILKSTLPR